MAFFTGRGNGGEKRTKLSSITWDSKRSCGVSLRLRAASGVGCRQGGSAADDILGAGLVGCLVGLGWARSARWSQLPGRGGITRAGRQEAGHAGGCA
jgi:hypothetical protein